MDARRGQSDDDIAFRDAGPEAVAGYRRVLIGLIDEADRAAVLDLLAGD